MIYVGKASIAKIINNCANNPARSLIKPVLQYKTVIYILKCIN